MLFSMISVEKNAVMIAAKNPEPDIAAELAGLPYWSSASALSDRWLPPQPNFDATPLLHDRVSHPSTANGITARPDGFRKNGEVLLCFSPTNYHTFVVAGGQELHPRLYIHKWFVRPARPDTIRAGVFIRFKGLSPEDVQGFQDFLKSQEGGRSASCIHGALEVLETGLGIQIPGRTGRETSLAELYQMMMTRGVERNGKPVAMEAYRTLPVEWDDVPQDMVKHEKPFVPWVKLGVTFDRLRSLLRG